MNINDIIPDNMFPMQMTNPATNETFTVDADHELAEQIMWNRIKMFRLALLNESDWTQYNDSPLTEEQKLLWKNYRSELRDIPQNFDHPKLVVFPDPPEIV